jgi:hypothetical protein
MEQYGAVNNQDQGGRQMKRLLRPVGALLSSRVTSPVVIGIFLFFYIGIAFFTEDALTAQMELTRRNFFLLALLTLLPLNIAGRIVLETRRFLQRRQTVSGNATAINSELFDETIEIAAAPDFAELQGRLDTRGYKTRRTEYSLSAWKGVSVFPVRLLFLFSVFFLFVGILISLVTRTSYRGPVVEGVAMPTPSGNGGIVEQIRLEKASGRILSKELIMEVAPSVQGDERISCGIYPPTRYQGSYVYPRFLGVALLVKFSAPDLLADYEKHAILNIYPAGKEAPLEVPDSPYRLMLSMAKPDDGSDPFVTGRMVFIFKLLKDKDVLFTGNIPGGGTFARDGFRLSFPDFRRMVITDFIQDYGVMFIWTATLLLGVALVFWLPVRLFLPRREMLFIRQESDLLRACSRSEGKARAQIGIFNEVLDLFDAGRVGKLSQEVSQSTEYHN